MWVIAGVLLGLVVLATLVGFHTGPHAHVLAGVAGVLAAGILAIIAVTGGATALVWVLFAGDLTLSVGVGSMAWRGLSHRALPLGERPLLTRAGASGVAVNDLVPEGIVRVNGEEWTAVAVNAPVPAGTAVQVVGRGAVRLEVWGDETPNLFGAEVPGEPKGEAR